MLTRESYLRDFHGIVLRRSANLEITLTTPKGKRHYEDDVFGSVSRYMADSLYAAFPRCMRYEPTAVIQMGHGVDTNKVFDSVDLGAIMDKVVNPLLKVDAFKTAAEEVKAAFVSEQPDRNYALLQELSKLFTKLRKSDTTSLPFEAVHIARDARTDELLAFYNGELPLSCTFDNPITDGLKNLLQQYYPTGKVTEDGKRFVYKSNDPFRWINSTVIALPDVSAEATPLTSPENACKGAIGEAVAVTAHAKNEIGASMDDTYLAAFSHVSKYVSVDLNALQGAERDIAMFGTLSGKAIYDALSQSKKTRLLKEYKSSASQLYDLAEWLKIGVAFFKANCTVTGSIDDSIYTMLVAGRVVAQKAQLILDLKADPPTVGKK